jgi:hypothetical protein
MPFALPLWLAPYVLPALGKLAIVAPWLPGAGSLWRWLKVASYVATLAAGIWFGAKALAWWQGDLLTETAAKVRCDDTIAAAALKAREDAAAKKEQALAAREAIVALDEDAVNTLKTELDNARGINQGGGGVAVRADDEWLRAWMARQR